MRKTLLILTALPILFSCRGQGPESESSLDATGDAVSSRSQVPGAESTVSIVDGAGKTFCTGVLLNSKQVLTAAHCESPTGDYNVHFGLHEHSENVISGSFVKHNRYVNDKTYSADGDATVFGLNDLGIINLNQSVPSSWGVRPVRIASTSPRYGETLKVSGFGIGEELDEDNRSSTEHYDTQYGRPLKTVSNKMTGRPRLGTPLDYRNNDNPIFFYDAQRMFSMQADIRRVPSNNIEVQTKLCSGDSGSGVFNLSGQLVGINVAGTDKVSISRRRFLDCETGYSYSVDVTKYLNWIRTQSESTPSFSSSIRIEEKSIVEGYRDSDFISKSLKIVNETTSTINEFYAAPDFSPNFGFNIAYSEQIQAGQTRQIRITDRSCKYYFKAVLSNGEVKNYDGNVCGNITKLTVK